MMTRGLNSLRSNEWSSAFIDGFRWQEERALKLFGALAENTSCSTLIFQNATLTETISTAFQQAMIRNKSLKIANLRNLTSDQGGLYPIPSCMFSQRETLESLTMMKVRLDTPACQSLGRLLQQSTSLRSLTLEEFAIDVEGFSFLLEGIAKAKSLTTLKLGKVEWSQEDIQRLLQALASNKTITKLSLESMQLNATNALDLAKLLKKNVTVEQLSLRRNSLDSAAVQLLFSKGLNQTLQKLFLSRNPLGDASAPMLANFLITNTTLHEICLVDTDLNAAGCIEIAQALKFNTALQVLSLNEINMEHSGAALLESLQERNVSLRTILGHFPATPVWKQVDFYLRANTANRRFLHEDKIQGQHLPRIFAAAAPQPDVLFHFIRSSGNHLLPTTIAANKPAVAPKRMRRVTTSLLLSQLKDMNIPPAISRSAASPRHMVPHAA